MNISSLSLKDLVILESLLTTCSVTKTAQKNYLSQPGVSHILRFLREHLRDDILIKGRQGMESTERCKKILPELRKILFNLHKLLEQEQEFNPHQDKAEFHIVGTEWFNILFFPELIKKLEIYSEHIVLRCSTIYFQELHLRNISKDLDANLCIGFPRKIPDWEGLTFGRSNFSVFSSVKNRSEIEDLSLAKYLTLKHVGINSADEWNVVINCLGGPDPRGDNLKVQVDNLSAVLNLTANYGYFCTQPTVYTQEIAEKLGYKIYPQKLPFPTPMFDGIMQWPAWFNKDKKNIWLRKQILSLPGFYNMGESI